MTDDVEHPAWGHFEGVVVVEWIRERGGDRRMQLREALAFVRGRSHARYANDRWVAHAGLVTDGASIPRVLWWLIGGPFDGDYREAAVIHDQACQDRIEPSPLVHRVFYEAMRAAGLSAWRALLLWAGVRLFGPRWSVPEPRRD